MVNYRRKYLCVCEGQQEILYLSHVARLMKDFPRKVVTFNAVKGQPHRLETGYEEYDSAALFDYDHREEQFRHSIEICDSLNKRLMPILVNSDRRSCAIRPSIPEISGHRSCGIRPAFLFYPAKGRHLMPIAASILISG